MGVEAELLYKGDESPFLNGRHWTYHTPLASTEKTQSRIQFCSSTTATLQEAHVMRLISQ